MSGKKGEVEEKILLERKLYSQKGLEYPHVTLSTNGIYARNGKV